MHLFIIHCICQRDKSDHPIRVLVMFFRLQQTPRTNRHFTSANHNNKNEHWNEWTATWCHRSSPSMYSGSTTSWLMSSKFSWPIQCSTFLFLPVKKLSTTVTSWPSIISLSVRWEPTKPAPPVICGGGNANHESRPSHSSTADWWTELGWMGFILMEREMGLNGRSAIWRFRENDMQLLTLCRVQCCFGTHLTRTFSHRCGILINLTLILNFTDTFSLYLLLFFFSWIIFTTLYKVSLLFQMFLTSQWNLEWNPNPTLGYSESFLWVSNNNNVFNNKEYFWEKNGSLRKQENYIFEIFWDGWWMSALRGNQGQTGETTSEQMNKEWVHKWKRRRPVFHIPKSSSGPFPTRISQEDISG